MGLIGTGNWMRRRKRWRYGQDRTGESDRGDSRERKNNGTFFVSFAKGDKQWGGEEERERGGRERESASERASELVSVCVFMNEVSHCRCVIGPTSL